MLLYTFRLNKTSGLGSEKCTGGKQFTDGMTMLVVHALQRTNKLMYSIINKIKTPQKVNSTYNATIP